MFKGQEMLLSLAVMNILFCSKYLVLVQPGWWSVVAILNWIIGLSGNRVPQTIVVYHHSRTQMVMVGYVYVYVYIYYIISIPLCPHALKPMKSLGLIVVVTMINLIYFEQIESLVT